MPYLIILEDGKLYQCEKPTEYDFIMAESGVIDLVNTDTLESYYHSGWNKIDVYEGESE